MLLQGFPRTLARVAQTPNDALADWVARSVAPGVVFSAQSNTTPPLSNVRGFAPQYILDEGTGNQDHWSLDTNNPPPGFAASLCEQVRSADGPNSSSIATYFGGARTFGPGSTLCVQFYIKADRAQAWQQWYANYTGGHKLAICSSWPSSVVNEVVPQVTNNRNIITAYHQDGSSSPPFDSAFSSDCSGSDFLQQNAIDHYKPALTGNDPATGNPWTSCDQASREFGPLYSAQSTPPFRQGYGHPLDGGFRQVPDQWIVLEIRLVIGTFGGSSGNRFSLWGAIYGQAPTKIVEAPTSSFTLGTWDPYETLWLLAYTSQRSPGGRQVSSITGEIGGVGVSNCGIGTSIGAGTLEYTASTGAFRFKAVNDSYGSTAFLSHANGVDVINVASSGDRNSTTTTADLTFPVTTVPVASTAGFPTTGTLRLGSPDTTQGGVGELGVDYTGISGNSFTGCSGGAGFRASGSPVSTASHVVVELTNAGALPSSGVTTMTVNVADGRPLGHVWYGPIIVSTSLINFPGGLTPTG